MVNDLTRYFDQNPVLAGSLDTYSNPFDALYVVNPEIGSLAYAARDQFMEPSLLRAMGTFREAQRDEKIATLEAMVNALGIQSEERKYELLMGTTKDLKQMECDLGRYQTDADERKHGRDCDVEDHRIDAEERRVGLQEKGLTERTGIVANTALDLMRVMRDTAIAIVRQQMETQRYLSDNQIRAVYIEATALRDMVTFVESARAQVRGKEIDAQLKQKIVEAELAYLTKVQEAEELRRREEGRNARDVVLGYMKLQGQIARDATVLELQYDTSRTALVQHYLSEQGKIVRESLALDKEKVKADARTLEVMTREAARLLGKGDVGAVVIDFKMPNTEGGYYRMEAKKNGK